MPALARSGSAALWLAIWWMPLVAMAADAHVRMVDPESVPAATWVWVLGLSAAGWVASRGHELAAWTDAHRSVPILAQSVVASLLAGVAAWLGALYVELPKAAGFLACIGASYGGSEYLARLRSKDK